VGLINFFSKPRVWVATIFLSITLVAIIIGKIALALFLALLIYLGTKELINFARAKGLNPSVPVILTVDFFLILFATIQSFDRICQSKYYDFLAPFSALIDTTCSFVKSADYLGMVITIGVIATFITILFRGKKATISDTAATVLVFMYGGWLPMHIMLLRNLYGSGIYLFGIHVREGLGFIILIFLVITLSDIAAYYVGMHFGKKPLWPEISPKKTREGAIAGTTVSGLLLSITAQFGDLAESMMKRDAGFKDSSNILPGHGGVLDRADSYIFTGAVAYYYFSLFVIG